jgi:hypothetical protein
MACYGATVAAAVTSMPAAAEAAGLRAFEGAAWLPLLAMLLTAAAAGGLARAGCRLSSGDLQLRDQLVPPRLQQLLDRLGSALPRTGGGSISTFGSRPMSPTAAAAGASAAAAWGREAAAAPWQLAMHLLLRLLWYSGILAVPLVLFVVGVQQYNVLHGIYLAGARQPATWRISWWSWFACADGICRSEPASCVAAFFLTADLAPLLWCRPSGLAGEQDAAPQTFGWRGEPCLKCGRLGRQGRRQQVVCSVHAAAVCAYARPARCVLPRCTVCWPC